MNASRPDEKRLAPGPAECRNICRERDYRGWQPVERVQANRGRVQHFARLRATRGMESLTMAEARRPDVIVAYAMGGRPVSQAHGGPVRLYVAPMYGYKSIKWLSHIQVVDRVEPGYWETVGNYDVEAWVGRSNGRNDPTT